MDDFPDQVQTQRIGEHYQSRYNDHIQSIYNDYYGIRKNKVDKMVKEQPTKVKSPAKVKTERPAKSDVVTANNPTPAVKAAKKKKKKPEIMITRTINISSLVISCVNAVEEQISSYSANLDVDFSKDERKRIIKAIKDNLKD